MCSAVKMFIHFRPQTWLKGYVLEIFDVFIFQSRILNPILTIKKCWPPDINFISPKLAL